MPGSLVALIAAAALLFGGAGAPVCDAGGCDPGSALIGAGAACAPLAQADGGCCADEGRKNCCAEKAPESPGLVKKDFTPRHRTDFQPVTAPAWVTAFAPVRGGAEGPPARLASRAGPPSVPSLHSRLLL